MTRGQDRYGPDVLSTDWRRRPRGRSTPTEATPGLVVEEVGSGFCGVVRGCEAGDVLLEDRHGARRAFPLGPGFLLHGRPVLLRAPARGRPARPIRTASGSVAVPAAARVARAARIVVEGRHDAELVERVWGDDLRIEGVVVEQLAGVDELPALVARLRPTAGSRLGVLVDHLVPGSKESRIAADVVDGPYGDSVRVLGHPYVDVWQAVRPAAIGIAAWPDVPRGTPWKAGVAAALGWPHANSADLAMAWRRILASVQSIADLEPALSGRVEELIDYVTAD